MPNSSSAWNCDSTPPIVVTRDISLRCGAEFLDFGQGIGRGIDRGQQPGRDHVRLHDGCDLESIVSARVARRRRRSPRRHRDRLAASGARHGASSVVPRHRGSSPQTQPAGSTHDLTLPAAEFQISLSRRCAAGFPVATRRAGPPPCRTPRDRCRLLQDLPITALDFCFGKQRRVPRRQGKNRSAAVSLVHARAAANTVHPF